MSFVKIFYTNNNIQLTFNQVFEIMENDPLIF